jgi:hypothetical protein
VTAADVNDDGKLDLIVANAGSGTLSVLLGNGNGTFGSPTNLTVGTTPIFVTAADVNLDGALDLIATNSGSGNVSVLLGNKPPAAGAAFANLPGGFRGTSLGDGSVSNSYAMLDTALLDALYAQYLDGQQGLYVGGGQ